MVKITFNEIIKALDDFKLPAFDLVIGIGDGGIVPAALTAKKLGCELRVIKISHRDEFNKPKTETPELIKMFDDKITGKRILIVDDVSVTGKTLNEAKKLFPGNDIKTFAFKGNVADYILITHINECVAWPWKI